MKKELLLLGEIVEENYSLINEVVLIQFYKHQKCERVLQSAHAHEEIIFQGYYGHDFLSCM